MRTLEEMIPDGMSFEEFSMRCLHLDYFIENVLDSKMDEFHREQMSYLFGNRYVYIVSPRGHLKTTIFSIAYPIWRMWKDRNLEICLVTQTLDYSKKVLAKIQDYITKNEFLKHLQGNREWSTTGIRTSNENYMFIKPFSDVIQGTHSDIFICDDILRDKEKTHDQIREVFLQTIFPTVQTTKGKLMVVGTAKTLEDLFFHDTEGLVQNPAFKGKVWSAVIMDSMGRWKAPLWKNNFTLEELKHIQATQGTLYFAREYLCNPMAGGSSLFEEEVIKRQTKTYNQLQKRRGIYKYYLGIDVAISKKAGADWSVFIVLEVDPHDNIRMVKLERYHGKSTKWHVERTEELHDDFMFSRISVEDMGLSSGLVRELQNIDGWSYLVNPVRTQQGGAKEDLVSKIEAALSTGALIILNHPILQKELRGFGLKRKKGGGYELCGLIGHDDCVLSLGIALDGFYGKGRGVAGAEWV